MIERSAYRARNPDVLGSSSALTYHQTNIWIICFPGDPELKPPTKLVNKQRKVNSEAHVPTLWYDQYRTHALNHITLAVAAMDSCFTLAGAHQHGIASTVSLTDHRPCFVLQCLLCVVNKQLAHPAS